MATLALMTRRRPLLMMPTLPLDVEPRLKRRSGERCLCRCGRTAFAGSQSRHVFQSTSGSQRQLRSFCAAATSLGDQPSLLLLPHPHESPFVRSAWQFPALWELDFTGLGDKPFSFFGAVCPFTPYGFAVMSRAASEQATAEEGADAAVSAPALSARSWAADEAGTGQGGLGIRSPGSRRGGGVIIFAAVPAGLEARFKTLASLLLQEMTATW